MAYWLTDYICFVFELRLWRYHLQLRKAKGFSFNLDYKDSYDLNYRIFIHDPKFNHILLNSLFPRILLQYTTGQNFKAGYFDYYEIKVTEHHRLNRPEQPCEEEED